MYQGHTNTDRRESMPAPEQDVFAEAMAQAAPQVGGEEPASVTRLETNTPVNFVNIEPPGEGNLWILFTYDGTPAAEVWLWDGTKPVPVPANTPTTLAYRAGYRLMYKLGEATQKMTLSWGFE
jgi:hypothetical protein